ncbi:MAG: arsenite efflux transporter metallochaperone ArsD [Acetobacterium sp.]
MSKVEIFEPAMCCSSGVCGPGVDKELLRVSTLLNALEAQGKKVNRYNLSQDPQAYVDNKAVNEALTKEGTEALPITVVDGEIKKTGSYGTNLEIATWIGMSQDELVIMLLKAKAPMAGGCCGGGSSPGGGCGGGKSGSGCC